jgi:hypothetical protein
VSLFAAWRSRSPALLAFGGDSAIELFSAVVVLWRFRASDAHADVEKRAAYVATTSVTSLLGYSEPKTIFLGIAILVAAAAVMPWLERKAATVRSYRQCCVEGGRCSVGIVCLSLTHRLGRTGDQRGLARKVGRPHFRFSSSAAHRLGGVRKPKHCGSFGFRRVSGSW